MAQKVLGQHNGLCIMLAAMLALMALVLVPASQAHAAEKSWSFSFLGTKTFYSSIAQKTVTGSASATIQKARSNVFMLKNGKVVLRVRNSKNEMASDSKTYTSYCTKKMAYWSGFGGKKNYYKLAGQLDSTSGTKSAYAGGTWRP